MRRGLLVGPAFCRLQSDPEAGPLPPGVHVVRGDSPAGAVKSAGARHVISLPDNLAVGPASRSVKLHPKVRERYWRLAYSTARLGPDEDESLTGTVSLLGADGVAQAHAKIGGPILVWGTGFWSDLLMLGWLFDGVRRRGGEWDRVAFAGDQRITMPLGWVNPEQLLPFGRSASPVPAPHEQALIDLWRAYTAATPEHLERLRRKPPLALPTLVEGLGVYASQLPRRLGRSRRLRLPPVDEVLLNLVPSRRFVRFPDLFEGAPPSRARWPRAGLYSMLSYFGEVFIQERLAAWSFGQNPAIEQVALPPGSDPGGRPHATSWRLTARGRALVADGLDDSEDCPEQIVGGYRSGRTESWCCHVTPGGWRLERC